MRLRIYVRIFYLTPPRVEQAHRRIIHEGFYQIDGTHAPLHLNLLTTGVLFEKGLVKLVFTYHGDVDAALTSRIREGEV